MPFYPAALCDVIPARGEDAVLRDVRRGGDGRDPGGGPGLAGGAGAGRGRAGGAGRGPGAPGVGHGAPRAGGGWGRGGGPALVAARAGRIGPGALVVFLKPVAVAAAV